MYYTSIMINNLNKYNNIGLGTYGLYNEDCTNIVKNALEIGYTLIDTAQLYKNQEFIKNGIIQSQIPRSNIFITSKIHNKNIIKKKVPESIYNIKQELDTDYIDMILLHNPVKNYVEGWKELIYSQHHLNILNIGVSNFNVEHLQTIYEKNDFYPTFNQFEFNVFNQRKELVDFMFDNNIDCQSHTGLCRGQFFNNPVLNNMSLKNDLEVADIMHKFILQKNIGIIPMTHNIKHLFQNLNLNKIINLDNNTISLLNNLDQQFSLFKKY